MLSDSDVIQMPANFIPAFRSDLARQRRVERNILLRTWGGIGDQICAEPTLRYALKTFKDCKVSLASECPYLFQHLNFERVFDLREIQPIWSNYLLFDTIKNQTSEDLFTQFVSHMLTNCVDYPSICAFRCMLPISDREVKLVPTEEDFWKVSLAGDPDWRIVIHPGRHWQSKTFPKAWWETVVNCLVDFGATPVLIGGNVDDNRGTVDIEPPEGCIDLRGKLRLMETVALLKSSRVLLTNDSSPLHMAVDSDAWIGFVATCKHPDYIMHWRRGQWAWRMQNLGRGGIWDHVDFCPNRNEELSMENVGQDRLMSWLPDPREFAEWGISKLRT